MRKLLGWILVAPLILVMIGISIILPLYMGIVEGAWGLLIVFWGALLIVASAMGGSILMEESDENITQR